MEEKNYGSKTKESSSKENDQAPNRSPLHGSQDDPHDSQKSCAPPLVSIADFSIFAVYGRESHF